ncbi:MAG: hypothetical protein MHM6MM_002129, partial [Cercozoa sp. M6MM]
EHAIVRAVREHKENAKVHVFARAACAEILQRRCARVAQNWQRFCFASVATCSEHARTLSVAEQSLFRQTRHVADFGDFDVSSDDPDLVFEAAVATLERGIVRTNAVLTLLQSVHKALDIEQRLRAKSQLLLPDLSVSDSSSVSEAEKILGNDFYDVLRCEDDDDCVDEQPGPRSRRQGCFCRPAAIQLFVSPVDRCVCGDAYSENARGGLDFVNALLPESQRQQDHAQFKNNLRNLPLQTQRLASAMHALGELHAAQFMLVQTCASQLAEHVAPPASTCLDDLRAEVKRIKRMQQQNLTLYNNAYDKFQRAKLTQSKAETTLRANRHRLLEAREAHSNRTSTSLLARAKANSKVKSASTAVDKGITAVATAQNNAENAAIALDTATEKKEERQRQLLDELRRLEQQRVRVQRSVLGNLCLELRRWAEGTQEATQRCTRAWRRIGVARELSLWSDSARLRLLSPEARQVPEFLSKELQRLSERLPDLRQFDLLPEQEEADRPRYSMSTSRTSRSEREIHADSAGATDAPPTPSLFAQVTGSHADDTVQSDQESRRHRDSHSCSHADRDELQQTPLDDTLDLASDVDVDSALHLSDVDL